MGSIRLHGLLDCLDVPGLAGSGNTGLSIRGIASDSRKVADGFLFIAVQGFETDGHRYIDEAVRNGAGVVVCEKVPDNLHEEVVYVAVPDSRAAMARIAKRFYRDIADTLDIIGVTGTNGKTTTARLMAAVMNDCGICTGYIGTGLAMAGGETIPLDRTTPEAEDLHRLFAMMAERGCTAVVMEVSSHALVLQRTHGIGFRGAVFTNLTQDHLDFHRTMEDYARAKRMLFGSIRPGGFAVVNADDPWAETMADNRGDAALLCCSVGQSVFNCTGGVVLQADVVSADMEKSVVHIGSGENRITAAFRLPGLYNVMNMLEVFAASTAMGLQPGMVVRSLEQAGPVEGRMEIVSGEGDGCSVVVDYAHTPDALEKVLGTLRELAKPGSRLAVVFGCGGNRDRKKRPKMGKAASNGADSIIITSDNPRDEEPGTILDDITKGISASLFMRIADRAEAIRCGVNLMKDGDILLVAGKGHEAYQETAGHRRHFSDREIAQSVLRQRKHGN